MKMIELLACRLGRNDEVPNIELAEKLCESMDTNGIREISDGLKSGDQATANDCIKVLYEIGQRKPELIAGFADDFITALSSRNNRIVWGSMTALAYIAPVAPKALFGRLPEIISAYERGSVITVDNSISVFAQLYKAGRGGGDGRGGSEDRGGSDGSDGGDGVNGGAHEARIFPLLLEHLAKCRAKEIPQHAERIAVCIDAGNIQAFTDALNARLDELSGSQKKRVLKIIKTVNEMVYNL